MKQLKKARGGARPGAGRKKGGKNLSTITKEQGREALRALVLEHLRPLVASQLENAKGISHFFLRDPKSGQFERITDEKLIVAALNSGDEGRYYYIFTKDPSVQAFTDLMNRTLDKPAEHVELEGNADKPILFRWLTANEKS